MENSKSFFGNLMTPSQAAELPAVQEAEAPEVRETEAPKKKTRKRSPKPTPETKPAEEKTAEPAAEQEVKPAEETAAEPAVAAAAEPAVVPEADTAEPEAKPAPKRRPPKGTQILLRLDPTTAQKLKTRAEKYGMSYSTYVTLLIQKAK